MAICLLMSPRKTCSRIKIHAPIFSHFTYCFGVLLSKSKYKGKKSRQCVSSSMPVLAILWEMFWSSSWKICAKDLVIVVHGSPMKCEVLLIAVNSFLFSVAVNSKKEAFNNHFWGFSLSLIITTLVWCLLRDWTVGIIPSNSLRGVRGR